MSGYLLVLAILLAGQVSPANDPYGASGRQPIGNSQPAQQIGDELIDIFAPPPDGSGTSRDTPPATNGGTDAYGASASPAGNQPASPFSGTVIPPGTSAPPSGFGASQQQSPPQANATPAANAAATVKPSALMRTMLAPPPGSRLTGERTSLADVIAGAASRAEQSERIDAYWEMCSSVADYYLGLGEQDELKRLRSSVQRIGPTWEQAEKELAIRIGTSERAARASQLRLANWTGQLGSLPLPGDMPHCGSYHTHYDEIFAGRPSQEAQELSALLPLRYAELKDSAMAVTRAEEWLNTIASMRNENSDGTGTLRALELWALRRRAFVQIARDYNRRIARYSELATPGQLPAERLVGMLILRDNRSTATRPSDPAVPSTRQSGENGRSVPRTFSGGWMPSAIGAATNVTRDRAIEPASAEQQTAPRQERSLLVKPR